jgi:predicted nucleic acid-binding protein
VIVADCSAVVHVFTAASLDDTLADRLATEPLHAPHLLDVEILHALRGLVIGHKISPDRAEHARHLYAQTTINRYPISALADRIWSLRHNLTAYDAAYIALAEVLACPLVTRDAKLVRAGHTADVALYTN